MSSTVTTPEDPHLRSAIQRKGSFLQTLRAVGWSFFGVRKGAEHDRDMQQLNPVHVIVAGIIGALLFIGLLVFVVHAVVGNAAG